MSHVDASALAGYNSLLDPHLAGYFSNGRMKKHLRKSGLIRRNGEIVSENTYRLEMARKEHKKHVRELLAQAIVHRTLDMERSRQVAIKKKLEEIAKIELVRRVRADRDRRGDEDILPLLTPRGSSRRSRSSGPRSRPQSAPNRHRPNSADSKVLVVDDDGMPITPRSASSSPDSSPERSQSKGKKRGSKYPKGDLDDKHLYSLDRQALYEYTMARQSIEQGQGPSPYRYPQLPPTSHRSPSPRSKSARQSKGKGAKKDDKQQRSGKGTLMLHRTEPALKHQERVQTFCDVTVHYFGSSLKLDYEKFDPRDEITVEQQHCGGNTLPVFREKVLPGHDFTFTSRRHRGFPFGLTFYINGVEDCRLSACCEYKHQSGSRLGGKKGHFGIVGVAGSAPCFKCQLHKESSAKKDKKNKKTQKKKEEEGEGKKEKGKKSKDTGRSEVDVRGYGDKETSRSTKDDIKVPVNDDDDNNDNEDDYENDFEDEEDDRSSQRKYRRSSSVSSRSRSGSRSSRSSSRSRSRSRSSSASSRPNSRKSDNAR